MAQICSLLAHAYNYGVFILRGSSKGWGRREGEEGGGGGRGEGDYLRNLNAKHLGIIRVIDICYHRCLFAF